MLYNDIVLRCFYSNRLICVHCTLRNVSLCVGGVDYVPVSEMLVLMAGPSPRVCVDITILDDQIDEENEIFRLDIANNNNWPEFRTTALVTIIDNGKCSFPRAQTATNAFSHHFLQRMFQLDCNRLTTQSLRVRILY